MTSGSTTDQPRDRLDEIDRNARAYGFEIGRGAPMAEKLERISDDNPFLDPAWRDRLPTARVDADTPKADALETLSAAGVPALIAEVERLQRLAHARSMQVTEHRELMGRMQTRYEEVRAQRQAALDVCRRAAATGTRLKRADIEAALGATE